MDRFTHRVVATERERHVGDAAGNQGVRQLAFDVFARADKVLRVVVVLFNTGRDGEDIGVEDDVFWRETDLFGQDLVRPTANFNLAFAGVCLADFIKRHHHHSGTVATHKFGVVDERLDPLFH
ncbi:hypothetical protein D3C87_1729340 [compost metagenome]